jgi:hypothetical protein
MMRVSAIVALMLLACLAAGAQQKKEEKRPTLGPSPAPSMEGPTNAVTTDPARLERVRKIYIESMDNRLSDKLLDDFGNSGRFQIVAERKQADAVLRGTCFDSRRLKTLHSEVFLNDRVSGKSIWQDSVRVPVYPPALSKAVDATADAILKHLAASVMHPRNRQ